MFIGPRKLPEYARKIGKMMADFRSTTSDFKETWQREVNFEDETKALRLDDDDEPIEQVGESALSSQPLEDKEQKATPQVKSMDKAEFDKRVASSKANQDIEPELPDSDSGSDQNPRADDKRNWL